MRDWLLKMAEAYSQQAYLICESKLPRQEEHGTVEEALAKSIFFLWAAEQV